jgi:hypothetical protein
LHCALRPFYAALIAKRFDVKLVNDASALMDSVNMYASFYTAVKKSVE